MAEKQNVPSWLERALDPTTPTTENNETVRTANNYFDDIGAEIIYPTIRMGDDGKLYTPEDPMEEAIKNNDYIVVEGPPNRETAEKAMQISKQISNQISASRTKEDATDKGIMAQEERMTSDTVSFDKGGMPERDDGILAPFDIKSKAEQYVKELRKEEDTNYDEADNKYDAIRHIGASLAMYAQYPDLASDIILGGKEYLGSIGDPRGKEMDLHNNAIGKAIYESLSKEEAENLTTEKALEMAKEYFEKAQSDESIPEEMRPKVIYGATKEPEKEDGGLYEIGPEGTWVEKAKMDKGGLMAADGVDVSKSAEDLLDEFNVFEGSTAIIYGDEARERDAKVYDDPVAQKMNRQLDTAFRKLFNKEDTVTREDYSKTVQVIRNQNPEVFDKYFFGPNTDAKIEALNYEEFSDNPLPHMDEEAEAVSYTLNIPFGSENELTLGGPTGLRGWARPKNRYDDEEIFVAGKGGEDAPKRSATARHEVRHLKHGEYEGRSGTWEENRMRDLDALDAVLSQDPVKIQDIFDLEYGSKLKKNPESFPTYVRWFSNTLRERLQNAVNLLPELYRDGVFDKSKADKELVKQFLEDYDKDEQGFVDSLLGNDPEKQTDVDIKTSTTDAKKLAKILSVAPFVEESDRGGSSWPYRVDYKIDREAAEMDEGGLMADPLVLSETAEEEAEPKMGIGEYIEGAKELATDFSPAGTAQAMIDAAGEAYKLATGAEDASLLDFGIAAIGALPGGKTATKAVETASKVADDVVEASQSIAKLDNYVPKKTVTAYKLVKEKNGKFYPLFVGQGKEKSDFPVGEWIKAEAGELSPKGKVKSSIGELAYRPGFHAGDLPIATHIGGKSSKAATKPDYRPDDQVWVEIEMANDVDWGSEALKRAQKTKDGRIKSVTAHITDMVPTGGHYRYKTNPNMTGEWLIGGEMKVTRVLDDAEVRKINEAAGVADLPRKSELDTASGLMSAEGAAKKSPTVDMAINVRVDKKADLDYAEKLISGEKVYETRNSRSLDPYIGQRVGIAKTGDGKAQAIGSVEIGEPIEVDEKTFRELQDKHLVPEGSAFDVPKGGKKYLYPVSNPERFESPKDVGRGIVSRKIVNKYAGGLMSDEYNRAES